MADKTRYISEEVLKGKINQSTRVNIKGTTGYTIPSDGYVSWANNVSSTGGMNVYVDEVLMLNASVNKLGDYERRNLYVKKGMVIKDQTNANNYYFNFYPFE